MSKLIYKQPERNRISFYLGPKPSTNEKIETLKVALTMAPPPTSQVWNWNPLMQLQLFYCLHVIMPFAEQIGNIQTIT